MGKKERERNRKEEIEGIKRGKERERNKERGRKRMKERERRNHKKDVGGR
jgi:hypothetical protein